MSNARMLLPGCRAQLTPAFRMGRNRPELRDYVQECDIGRDLPFETVERLLLEARECFDDDPVASDRWLAPRLHAALRLTRAEAGERYFWMWLAVEEFPDYVWWRFPGKTDDPDPAKNGTALKRFIGRDRDHALGRLWWGAELFRRGGDYSPVVKSFEMQDIPNTWLSLDAIHNAAAAQAALVYLPGLNSDDINAFSKAMDHILTTVQLDAVAPLGAPDTIAVEEWIEGHADIDELLSNELPAGPDEDPPSAETIEAVDVLLRHVAELIKLELPAVGIPA
jgi:hypothetical protein